MKANLPRRMHELREVARTLQSQGWTISHIGLEYAESDQGTYPVGSLVVRFDPPREEDVL